MPVITISGSIASGAREVGQALAALLRIHYVDRQLLVEAARRCGVPVVTMAQRDERCASLGERLAAAVRSLLERSAAGGEPLAGSGLEFLLSRTYMELTAERGGQELTDDLYLRTMTDLIRELAQGGNVVIVGRGSQMILRDLPGALHVLCLAPREVRIQRLALREGLDPEEAAHRLAEIDRARASFYHKFWKVDPDDPSLYDLTIETSRLPYPRAAEVVAAAARAVEASRGSGEEDTSP